MSNAPSNHDTSPQDIERNEVLIAIGNKWSEFSKEELSALKSTDDLVSQVVRKYGVEEIVAQSDVETLMAGRNL